MCHMKRHVTFARKCISPENEDRLKIDCLASKHSSTCIQPPLPKPVFCVVLSTSGRQNCYCFGLRLDNPMLSVGFDLHHCLMRFIFLIHCGEIALHHPFRLLSLDIANVSFAPFHEFFSHYLFHLIPRPLRDCQNTTF